MNKIVLLIFIFLLSSCKTSQFVGSNMIEIPTQKLKYSINGQKKSVEVFSFYISEYPESVSEYKEYLNSLSAEKFKSALPNAKFLSTYELTDEQIDFLSKKYYTNNAYNKYPVIALNKYQIKNYLEWKTNEIGKQVLNANGIDYDPIMTYLQIVRDQNIKSKFLQVEFLGLLETHAISAQMYLEDNSSSLIECENNEIVNNEVLKSLGINEVDCYQIQTSNNFSELIFNQIETKSHYESISQIGIRKYELNEGSKVLVPLRTWHIKI